MSKFSASQKLLAKIDEMRGLEVLRFLNGQHPFNDEIFKEIFNQQPKLSGEIQREQAILYCKEFLNWYVSGSNAENIAKIMLAVVASMKLPSKANDDKPQETFLWAEIFTAKAEDDQDSRISKLPAPKNFDKIKKIEYAEYNHAHYKFTEKELYDWYSQIFDGLDLKKHGEQAENDDGDGDADEQQPQQQRISILIDYLGFIALALLNGVKRSHKLCWQICNYATNDFNQYWHAADDIKVRTPPPHKLAAKQCTHEENFSENIIFILATYAFTASPQKQQVKRILEKACLNNLEFWGMGCLHWLLKAQKPSGFLAEHILNRCGQQTATTLELRDVLVNFMDATRKEITWRWARLVDPKAFIALSITKDPLLAATFAALAHQCDLEKPIWRNVHFDNDEIKKQAVHRATKILQGRKTQRKSAIKNKS